MTFNVVFAVFWIFLAIVMFTHEMGWYKWFLGDNTYGSKRPIWLGLFGFLFVVWVFNLIAWIF